MRRSGHSKVVGTWFDIVISSGNHSHIEIMSHTPRSGFISNPWEGTTKTKHLQVSCSMNIENHEFLLSYIYIIFCSSDKEEENIKFLWRKFLFSLNCTIRSNMLRSSPSPPRRHLAHYSLLCRSSVFNGGITCRVWCCFWSGKYSYRV